MKKTLKITALLTTLLIPTMACAGSTTEEEILRQLEYLNNKIAAQQEHIDALEATLSTDPKSKPQQIEQPQAQGAIVLANKAIDQLKIKADMRLRYEYRDREQDGSADDSRSRFRTRLRLGGVWQNKAENWEVGVGLATGGSGATSTNATWSGNRVFETTDLRVDYAYAKHHFGDLTVTAGQHKNPYKTSWLLWDSDVRPAGVTVQYGAKSGPFVTAGGYAISYDGVNNGNTANMYAGQAGWKGKLGKVKLTMAGGLQYWNSLVSKEFAPTGNADYDYTIGDLYTKASMPVGEVKLSAYAQVWNNFGADGNAGDGILGGTLDPEDESLGWILGVGAQFDKLKLKASYMQIGADSLFGDIKDADFGSGLTKTDLEGFVVEAIYGFSKNLAVVGEWNYYEAMERNLDDNVNLYQLDMIYKF